MTESTTRRRDGFTLVESLIVVVIMGVVIGSIAAIFSVVVRTTPSTEARADDARSLLGISTWLPADVSATPELPSAAATGSWDKAAGRASGCAGVDPGTNLLRLSWTEQVTNTPVTYVAAYRLVETPEVTSIQRVTCTIGGTRNVQTVTAGLPLASTNPVAVNWKTAVVSGVQHIIGVEMTIRTREGDTLRVDASSRNPDETLSTIPSGNTSPPTTPPATTTTTAPTTTTTTTTTTVPWTGPATTSTTTTTTTTLPNVPPTAAAATYSGRRDQAISFVLPVADPDGTTASLTVAYGSVPDGWTLSQPHPTTRVVTVAASNPGAGTYAMTYVVTDPRGGTASSTITVTLTPIPCAASFVSITPNPVANTAPGNQVAPLSQPVTVTISKSGDCGNLTLRYRLVSETSNPNDIEPAPNVDPFGASLTVTLASVATQRWEPTNRPLQLVEYEGLVNEVVHATQNLRVT